MTQGPAESREPLELAPESAPATDRIRHLPPYAAPDAAEKTAEKTASDPEGAKPGFVARFLELPRWEQYLAASALVCLLGWLGASAWISFFELSRPGGWFFTFALIGSLAVAMLTLAGAGPARWFGLSESSRKRAIITFAVLPAVGGAIELLQHFWAAVALVAAFAMAFAAIRLATDRSGSED